ncbi:hypothetical protein BB8028_0010g00250 [Beauveria bassiana]|uniref:Uncharacterized protein n=1 Tax=Beauveria bassiana TaxID=176275 RepID=A0A2S7YPL8_BEABA|nr:hypothetical protein BB8028_0010g00250 [Beauveria bassiana]
MIRRAFNIIYNQRQFPAERASTMLEQAQLYTPVSFQGQDSADTLATQLAILFRYYAFTLLTRPSSSGNFTSRPSRSTTGRERTCLLRASSPRTSPSCAYTRYSVIPQGFETTICGDRVCIQPSWSSSQTSSLTFTNIQVQAMSSSRPLPS